MKQAHKQTNSKIKTVIIAALAIFVIITGVMIFPMIKEEYCLRKAVKQYGNSFNDLLEPTELEKHDFGLTNITRGFRAQLQCERSLL